MRSCLSESCLTEASSGITFIHSIQLHDSFVMVPLESINLHLCAWRVGHHDIVCTNEWILLTYARLQCARSVSKKLGSSFSVNNSLTFLLHISYYIRNLCIEFLSQHIPTKHSPTRKSATVNYYFRSPNSPTMHDATNYISQIHTL